MHRFVNYECCAILLHSSSVPPDRGSFCETLNTEDAPNNYYTVQRNKVTIVVRLFEDVTVETDLDLLLSPMKQTATLLEVWNEARHL
jgi:hypothetical protein